MIDKIMHDEDVQVLFVDVYDDEFQPVVKQYSRRYYQLVYRVDAPEIDQVNYVTFFFLYCSTNRTAFLGGAFICGGSGGTEEKKPMKYIEKNGFRIAFELTRIILIIRRI